LGISTEDFKRLLREKKGKDIFDMMEIREIPGETTLRREFKLPNGQIIFAEERTIRINPYTGQQEINITYTSLRCENCGLPITVEKLAMDKVKVCVKCGRLVCTCGIKFNNAVLCSQCYQNSICESCGKPKPRLFYCQVCGARVCMDCSTIYKSFWEGERRVCWNCYHALRR